MVIAPIAKKYKSKKKCEAGECSKTDYERREYLASVNSNWCWDDGQFNKAQVGHCFAFLFFEEKVIIHKIIEIVEPKERPIEWKKKERNVLRLTPPIKTLSWDTWISSGGLKKRQGTYSVVFGDKNNTRKKTLFSNIQTNFNNI